MRAIVFIIFLLFSYSIYGDEIKQKEQQQNIIAESMIKDLINRLVIPEKTSQSSEIILSKDTLLKLPKKDPTYIPIEWNILNNEDITFSLILKKEIDIEVINGDIMITFGNGFQDEVNLCLRIKL